MRSRGHVIHGSKRLSSTMVFANELMEPVVIDPSVPLSIDIELKNSKLGHITFPNNIQIVPSYSRAASNSNAHAPSQFRNFAERLPTAARIVGLPYATARSPLSMYWPSILRSM